MKHEQYLPFGRPSYTDSEIAAVTRVMRSGWLGMGPETLEFERELAQYIGVPHVVTVNSCTSALFLALKVIDIGPGDEVIVPSLTWCSTANAALYLGATPVFCDVDLETLCLTPESVQACLTARTRAVVPVHYGGLAINIEAIAAVLPPEVAIVEDAAHAFGARNPDGTVVGVSGWLTCFSFYANKNLATAEGGAIALTSSTEAERLRRLRMHSMESHAWSRYIKPMTLTPIFIEELGYKMNYTDLQAAIGRVQLARLSEMTQRRHEIAQRYHEFFERHLPQIPFQRDSFAEHHARHLLVGLFDPKRTGIKRDQLLKHLRELNVGVSVHYRPLHVMPLYRPYARGALPNTETLAECIMTLPISASMELEHVDYVCEQIAALVSEG